MWCVYNSDTIFRLTQKIRKIHSLSLDVIVEVGFWLYYQRVQIRLSDCTSHLDATWTLYRKFGTINLSQITFRKFTVNYFSIRKFGD